MRVVILFSFASGTEYIHLKFKCQINVNVWVGKSWSIGCWVTGWCIRGILQVFKTGAIGSQFSLKLGKKLEVRMKTIRTWKTKQGFKLVSQVNWSWRQFQGQFWICITVVAFPFATCLANNYFQKFFFFALTSSQLFSLSPGRFCNFSTFSFW